MPSHTTPVIVKPFKRRADYWGARDLDPWVYEKQAWRNGARNVAGMDEAGCGPLAGPVVAAVVILPMGFDTDGTFDSKNLSEQARERSYLHIQRHAIDFAFGQVEADEIDRINIAQATHLAMRRALDKLAVIPDMVLTDGQEVPGLCDPLPCRGIIKGDALSANIAAASILAKVYRDHLMRDYDRRYPEYHFDRHKGYGTEAHLQALDLHGPCPIHRQTYLPVVKRVRLDGTYGFAVQQAPRPVAGLEREEVDRNPATDADVSPVRPDSENAP